jgi:hypothetical protein
MNKIIATVLNQLAQNSTWRGLLLILTSAGIVIEPQMQEAILAAGLSAIGLINVIRKGK